MCIFFQFEKTSIDSFFVCESIDSCLNRLKNDENYDLAIGAPRQIILNSSFYSTSNIFCLDRNERIASYQLVLMLRKDIQLKLRIDGIIQKAFESGLFVKWDSDSKRKQKRLHELNSEPNSEPRLPLKNFGSIWFICGTGYMFAIVAFIGEILIQYKMKQKHRYWFWIYLKRFVDGHRHYFRSIPEKLNGTLFQEHIYIPNTTRITKTKTKARKRWTV